MATPSADGLLQQVTARLRINQWVQAVSYWGLGWCGLSLALLIASRCLGLIPGWVNGWAVAAVPVVSALGAWLLLRPLGTDRAARQIDRHGNTKDLFLTYAALDTTVGGYQPIVVSQAEQAATRIKPELAVPITYGKTAHYALALFLGLVMGFLFLPQWDPFGRVAAVTDQQLQRKQLEQERQATRTRIAQIKQDTTESAVKSPAESSIDDLKRALQQMRPTEQQANREKLQVHQSQVGKQWKQLGAEKLKSLLQQGGESLQDFGGSRMQKMEKWTEQLKNGDTQMIRQEIKDLADLARQIAEAKDPVQQAELQREMKERLKDLERFAAERAGSPEAAAAVRRAMRQMEQAAKEGMDPQSLQDLAESLELSQMEIQQLAEAAKDLQQLEKALKTMKMAKQVNEDGKLDGEACQACRTLDDYAQLYQQMMADGNATNGEGTGGEGQGKGGKVDENDAINTAFKEETSKSAIRAGKSLLSMKTRGESEEGVANKEYQEQVERVRQSVSEAILQEQIPPGYHDSIRAFFQQDNSDGPSDPAASNPLDAAASEPVPSSDAGSP